MKVHRQRPSGRASAVIDGGSGPGEVSCLMTRGGAGGQSDADGGAPFVVRVPPAADRTSVVVARMAKRRARCVGDEKRAELLRFMRAIIVQSAGARGRGVIL